MTPHEGPDVVLFPPLDAFTMLAEIRRRRVRASAFILDPWYGRGVGELPEDPTTFFLRLVRAAVPVADHLLLWGFPDLLAPVLARLPSSVRLVAWLTWHVKNIPSRTRGWRPGQQTCLHLAKPGAILHPENYLSEEQRDLFRRGKLQFVPAPTTVIESPALVGWVGKAEKTGHPAQKPVKVIAHLLKMTTTPGDLVIDPMAGSGTTGAAAREVGCRAILGDHNPTYVEMMEARLSILRTQVVTRETIAKVEEVTPGDRHARRLAALTLLEGGTNQTEVGRQLGVSRQAVARWAKAHASGGAAALASRPRMGGTIRVPRATLAKILKLGATSFGFSDATWTGRRFASAIEKETEIRYHPVHARALLRQIAATGRRRSSPGLEANHVPPLVGR